MRLSEATPFLNQKDRAWRVEPLVKGRPASIGVVQSDKLNVLPPVWQNLDSPCGEYIDCQRIENPDLVAALHKAALQVAASMPFARGYFGIDLVVDTEPVVIEVNPRLTTSYCQTRHWCEDNPARWMLPNGNE